MNESDKQFWGERIDKLEDRVTKANHLRTKFSTWLKMHDKAEEDRNKDYCHKFDLVFDKLSDIKDNLSGLPCNVHVERIKELEKIEDDRSRNRLKIWLVSVGLIFTLVINIVSFVSTYTHFQEKVKDNTVSIQKIQKKVNYNEEINRGESK